MFGSSNQQLADDPAMLNNVAQLAAQPASQVEPPQPTTSALDPAGQIQVPAPAATAEPAAGFSSMPTDTPMVSLVSPQFANQTAPDNIATPMFTPPQPADPAPVSDTTPAFSMQQTSDPATMDNQQFANDTTSSVPPVDHDKLADMKQQALGHLEPLVDHLNQNAEEEFKTTMMMIQANDNHTLLDKALSAAKKIEDDKKRAEALLDIINEINYFSQIQNNQ